MADFVLNPDTGEVSRQVVQYERVEREALQNDVDRTANELNDANVRVEQLSADLEAAQTAQAAAASAHEEAKSGLQAYDEVAGTQTGVDAESTESGSDAETPADEAGTSESVTF